MGPLHTWGHFVAFLVTGALLCWNAEDFSSWFSRCLAGIAIAAVLEGLEVAVYHGTFEWRDLGTDCLGVVLGAAVVAGAAWLRSTIERRRAKARSLSIPANDPLLVRTGGKTRPRK
jgi:hypothetical protein